MKKLLFSLLALVTLSIAANAQEKREMPGKHQFKQKKAAIAHQLNFTQDQKKQAKLYKENYRKQLQELNKNESITVKEFRDKKYALAKEQKAKMQSLLSHEQKSKLEQLKTEHKARAEKHFAMKMDKMKTNLGLTDAQAATLKSQRENMMAKLKVIKEDNSMDRVAKKEKLMALKTQMKEDRKKVFTPEQLKKMEDMKKAKMEKKEAK